MHLQNTLDYPDDHPPIPLSPSSAASDVDHALTAAINLHHAGRSADAERLYRAIIASSSDHAVASYGLGLLCATQGRSREAIEAYLHAIAIRPDFVDAYINLGTMMLGLGRGKEAEAMYRHAIALSPDNAMAHGNLGKALHDLGRIEEAIAAYRAGIMLQPENALIHTNFGAVLLERQAWDDAATVTRRAIALDAADAMAHANLGTALFHLGRHEEALEACRECIALQPKGAAIHATLGGVMLELGALQEAAVLCRRAIALDPVQPDAHFNLSHALKGMNQLDEAALAAREAIALRPDSADYHFHLAHILLLQGNFEDGWSEYEWRKQQPDFAWIGNLLAGRPQPLWAGEDIRDKTILILTEQGLGDIIQFARYLPLVVRRAGRVIVTASPPTRRLLETIAGIEIVPARDVPQQDFDVYCPLLSLPRAFGTRHDRIPAQVPYLRADPSETARWNRRIGGGALRVGMVWAGNPATLRDRFRSPRLSSVAPLFSAPGVDFVVLQVGAGRNDCDADPLPPHVLDLGKEVTDLADTAAIMAGLDLMISSCTGPLHLAGALGVPTWAMIPFAPHFPWRLERTDTPWYPTMRLYRQEQFGQDWSGVVARIAVDLVALAQSKLDLQATTQAPPDVPPASATAAITSGSLGQATELPAQQTPETGGFNELARCRGGLMLFNRNDIYIGAGLRKYGEFTGGEARLFRMIVLQGMTVLDIGANIGVHTVELSRLAGSTGAVHAFEPQRLMFQLLCANVALNSCANVFAHQAAVGAAGGISLVPALDPEIAANYGGLSLPDAKQGETVPLITVDGLALPACHMIRLDVEGMETEVLRGGASTIAGFRPILYVRNDHETRSAELIGLLQAYGYRLYWHLPRVYSPDNFRGDAENIFGSAISANMLCVAAEIPQASLSALREVTEPDDRWQEEPKSAAA